MTPKGSKIKKQHKLIFISTSGYGGRAGAAAGAWARAGAGGGTGLLPMLVLGSSVAMLNREIQAKKIIFLTKIIIIKQKAQRKISF